MTLESQERNPYVGPRPFERRDRDIFFGRDRETSELLSLVMAHQVLLLYAQSGAGKTSLLNAGLVPLLEEEGFEILPLTRVRGLIPEDVKPKRISNLYIFNSLMSWAKDEIDPRRLAQMSLVSFLQGRDHPTDEMGLPSPRVVIFDQFEELFAFYPERWKDRRKFFEQVCDALETDPLLRVAFVIREDYIAQLDPYAPLLPEKLRTRFRLERLRKEAALSAITNPLEGRKRSFAEGAAEQLVNDLLNIRVETAAGKIETVTGEFVEPVQLQVVCQSLWQGLPPGVIIIAEDHLQTFGDVNQALSGFYERSIERAVQESGVKEGDLRTWFKQSLITPAGTRGTVYRGQEKTGGIPNAAMDVLEDLHLIRGEWRAGARWYELTHDRFIEPIQESNKAWLTKRQEEAAILANMAEMHRTKGQSKQALDLLEQALPIRREVGDRAGEAAILNNIAEVHRARGQPEQALELFQQALSIRREVGDRAGEAAILNNIAEVYRARGQPEQALELFQQTLSIRRQLGDRAEEATTLSEMGEASRAIGELERARALHERALSISREASDRSGEAAILNRLAYTLIDMERYQEALETLERSVELEKKVGHPSGESASLANMAVLLDRHLNRRTDAVARMKQAIEVLIEAGLSQNAAGHTVDELQQTLSTIRSGATISAEDNIQVIVENTVAVMTTAKDNRNEWRETIAGWLDQAKSINRRRDVEFFTAILAILDGQTPDLPEGHPYAEALASIQAEIAAGEPLKAQLIPQMLRQMRNPDSAIALRTVEELREHGWLADGSLQGARLLEANLREANLGGANLQEAHLQGADLQGANLQEANLQEADLRRVDLEWADLSRANLQRVDLLGADLQGANLSMANLQGANLAYANLQRAYLREVKLEEADLSSADLQGASFWKANLRRAKLFGANLQGALLREVKLEGNCSGIELLCQVASVFLWNSNVFFMQF